MLVIHVSSRFHRRWKKLPMHIQGDFQERIEVFRHSPFHPSLRTHKLRGNLGEYYAFCLRDGFHVLFDFASDNVVFLVNVGDHDEYQKWGRT